MAPRDVLLLALVVFAPWAVVLLVAILRGYDVTITMARRDKRPPP